MKLRLSKDILMLLRNEMGRTGLDRRVTPFNRCPMSLVTTSPCRWNHPQDSAVKSADASCRYLRDRVEINRCQNFKSPGSYLINPFRPFKVSASMADSSPLEGEEVNLLQVIVLQ